MLGVHLSMNFSKSDVSIHSHMGLTRNMAVNRGVWCREVHGPGINTGRNANFACMLDVRSRKMYMYM